VVLCGASLGVLLLVPIEQGQSKWFGLLILLIGIGGVLTQMRLAPILVLMLVTAGEIAQQWNWGPASDPELGAVFRVRNVLLCAAMLGYVAGHYRLQGLGRFVFPLDQRVENMRKRLHMPAGPWLVFPRRRRSARLVTPAEPLLLAGSLLLWAVAAQMVWHWLAQPRDVLDWNFRTVQWSVFVLVLVPALTVAASVLRFFRRRAMVPEEAMLMLQDTLWNETRGEQRWFARWLAWFSLRDKERS